MEKCKEYFFVAAFGATGYCILEILWRGYTHWTMAVVGALGLMTLYQVETKSTRQPLLIRALLGCLLLTGIELAAGVIINMLFGLQVWDYSMVPGNFLGQICFTYSMLWFLLCLMVLPIISFLRRWIYRPPAFEN